MALTDADGKYYKINTHNDDMLQLDNVFFLVYKDESHRHSDDPFLKPIQQIIRVEDDLLLKTILECQYNTEESIRNNLIHAMYIYAKTISPYDTYEDC